MTENEQIKELARAIESSGDCMEICFECQYYCYPNCQDVKIAEKLYAKGYRKVERGEWIKATPYSQEYCNKCGLTPKTIFGRLPKFCPNCGADMRGEKDAEIH